MEKKEKSKFLKKNSNFLLSYLKDKIQKTRSKLSFNKLNGLTKKRHIDESIIASIEEKLLTGDFGIKLTNEIMQEIRNKIKKRKLITEEDIITFLKRKLTEIAKKGENDLTFKKKEKPFIILMVGINGSGKTTTIGKIAKKIRNDKNSVILAAGDTFRAGAVEQLKNWGDKNDVSVISSKNSTDSASVIFNAIKIAKEKGIDVIMADTAGRLHNNINLMNELKKIHHIISKFNSEGRQEVMLVVDAINGQNSITQTQEFSKIIPITGITITKIDSTAKGGVIFNIINELKIPIRFIGTGEKISDLEKFDAEKFVEAVFS